MIRYNRIICSLVISLFFLPAIAVAQTGSGESKQSSQQVDNEKTESPSDEKEDDSEGEETKSKKTNQTKDGDSPDEEAKSTKPDRTKEGRQNNEQEKAREGSRSAGKDQGQFESVSEGQPESSDAKSADDENPLADLASKSKAKQEAFEPVEEIDTAPAESFVSEELYPHIEWDGLFRFRTSLMRNFDLGTRGTSLILPPAGTYTPSSGNPANPGAETLWSTDTRLRLEPTFHLTEDLRLHTEADLLDNVVMGSMPRQRGTTATSGGNPVISVGDSGQQSPDERSWTEDAVQVNEVWGEVDFFLGTVKAGRMDNDWGLGMFANDGDCLDCNYGDHVDRFEWRTSISELKLSAAIDYPGGGLTSQNESIDGAPYDLGQVDDIDQYTFTLSNVPTTDKEKRQQQQTLRQDEASVVNAGAYYSYRSRSGRFVSPSSSTNPATQSYAVNVDPRNPPQLIYRGESLHIPDVWAKYLYNPSADKLVRLELEANGVFGSMDNATRSAVGGTDSDGDPVNCFNESERNINREACTTTDSDDPQPTSEDIRQFGVAFESEFHFGGPVWFGLNGGFASGGNSTNWGYGSGAQNFYRFDPDYHVDLILFREVVGTVTNAYYANPWIRTEFFKSESGDSWMDFQFDAIASAAADRDGAPSDRSRMLGVEFDGALRFIEKGRFRSVLEGGILVPMDGLGGTRGDPRLTQYGSLQSNFQNNTDPSVAWTIQGNMFWTF